MAFNAEAKNGVGSVSPWPLPPATREVNLVLNPALKLSEYPLKRYYREAPLHERVSEVKAVLERSEALGGDPQMAYQKLRWSAGHSTSLMAAPWLS